MNSFTKYLLVSFVFISQQCIGAPAQVIGLPPFFAATIKDVQSFLRSQPNINGWVGPTQYIVNSNNQIRSFNKVTGQPDGILNIDSSSFFGITDFDTRITFDRFGQRWIGLAGVNDLSNGGAPTMVIAYSDGPIITNSTKWTSFVFPFTQIVLPPTGGAVDSPQLASDQNAVYLTVDTFPASFASFAGITLIVIPQSSFVPGTFGPYTVFTGIFPGVADFGEFTPPATNFDPNPTFGYMINAQNNFNGFPSGLNYTNLYMFRIINPGSATPTVGPQVTIPVNSYSDSGFVPHKGNLYGSVGFLETVQCTFDSAIHIRNKQLFAAHPSQMDSTGTGTFTGDRIGIIWYQFDLTGDSTGRGLGTETATTVPALVQTGIIFDSSATNPLFYWMPAIMTNKNGDLVISGNVAGNNNFIDVFYAGRTKNDPPGILRAPVNITNNTFAYNFGQFATVQGARWGDYNSLSPDPVNDIDMWSSNEAVFALNGWGILVTKLIPAI